MAKPIIKIDDRGVKTFMKSTELEKYLLKLSKRVTNDDNRYELRPHQRPSRIVVNIVDPSPGARSYEANTGKLARMSIIYITDEL